MRLSFVKLAFIFIGLIEVFLQTGNAAVPTWLMLASKTCAVLPQSNFTKPLQLKRKGFIFPESANDRFFVSELKYLYRGLPAAYPPVTEIAELVAKAKSREDLFHILPDGGGLIKYSGEFDIVYGENSLGLGVFLQRIPVDEGEVKNRSAMYLDAPDMSTRNLFLRMAGSLKPRNPQIENIRLLTLDPLPLAGEWRNREAVLEKWRIATSSPTSQQHGWSVEKYEDSAREFLARGTTKGAVVVTYFKNGNHLFRKIDFTTGEVLGFYIDGNGGVKIATYFIEKGLLTDFKLFGYMQFFWKKPSE